MKRRCKNKICDDQIEDEPLVFKPGWDLVYVSKYCPACRVMSKKAWARAALIAGIVVGVLWFAFRVLEKVFHL